MSEVYREDDEQLDVAPETVKNAGGTSCPKCGYCAHCGRDNETILKYAHKSVEKYLKDRAYYDLGCPEC